MICHVMTAQEFAADANVVRIVAAHLTKPNSDFHRKLAGWLAGMEPHEDDGSIALVSDDDEFIGWARSETWIDPDDGCPHDTLEAFVHEDHRNSGVAAFAAAGLVASGIDFINVAVFHPSMLLVARRAGLRPMLFERSGPAWVRA